MSWLGGEVDTVFDVPKTPDGEGDVAVTSTEKHWELVIADPKEKLPSEKWSISSLKEPFSTWRIQ